MMTMIMKVVTGDDDDDDNNNNDNLETKNNHGRLSKNPVSSILLLL